MKKALSPIFALILVVCMTFTGVTSLDAQPQLRGVQLESSELKSIISTGISIEKLYSSEEKLDEKAIHYATQQIWEESKLDHVVAKQQFDILRSYMFPNQMNGFTGDREAFDLCRGIAERYAEGVEFDLVKLVADKGVDQQKFRNNMTAFFQVYLFKGLVANNDLESIKTLYAKSISNEELLNLYRGYFTVELEDMMYFTINHADQPIYDLLYQKESN